MFRTAFFCALIPSALVFIATLLPDKGAQIVTGQLASQVRENTEAQITLDSTAQADRISARLDKIGGSVGMLRDYAAEVLATPGAYAAPWKPAAPAAGAAPAEAKPAAQPEGSAPATDPKAIPQVNITPKAVEKNLFYTVSPDGALRKVLGQGSAVFYRKQDTGSFGAQAMQKLYASTALDPLLSSLADSDELCGQMYFVTEDGLLRTYPFIDTAAWPSTKDLTTLSMYAWSKDKANSQGLVWTTPYVSHLSGNWVVACTASVQVGGKQMAIAGCEIDLSKFADELLAFSMGSEFYCWVSRPDGLVLGAQSGVFEEVGTRAIGQAELPAEKRPAEVLLDEANLFKTGFSEFGDLVKGEDGTVQSGVLRPLKQEGQYLFTAPIESSGWLLAGVVSNPVIGALRGTAQADAASQTRRTSIALIAMLTGLLAVLVITWLDSRKVVDPLRMLTQQVRRSADNGGKTPVALADEGEVGELAHAIQRLVDLCGRDTAGNFASSVSDWQEGSSAAPDDESVEPLNRPAGDQA